MSEATQAPDENVMNSHRRLSLSIATASLALISLCSSAVAEEKIDPTGSWSLRTVRPGRPAQESILKLEKNGDQLVGALTDSQGRTGSIKDAQLTGSDLSFRVEVEREGQQFTFVYKGKLDKDVLKGTVQSKMRGRELNLDFDGKRLAQNGTLAGSWKLALAMQGGPRGQGEARPQGAAPRPTGAGRGGRQGAALTRQMMLNLKEEGGKVSGDFVGFSGKPTSIQDVKVKDGELSFKVPQEMGPNKITIAFVAKLAGDKMLGTAKIMMPFGVRELGFQGERLITPKVSATGTWKLRVALKEGPSFEPTLKLTQTGTSLKGVYVGEQGETAITNALIFGDEITFDVARDRNGKTYRLHYQGKIKGDTLNGNVEYDFDGIGGYVSFAGERLTTPQASTDKVH
jgi:hypothetical protein